MLAVLKGIAADAVVTLCPSCALGLKRPPGGLPPELRSEAEALASRSFEIHELLSPVSSHPDDRLLNPPQPLNTPPLKETVLWHDPCHLRFGLGIYDEPRLLLRLAGVEPVDVGRQSCCGSAGLFTLTHPELSAAIGRRLAGETAGASAGLIATACPSCRMRLVDLSGNLAAGCAPAGVVHTVELLASKICLGEMNSEVSPDIKIVNYR
jgi:glycolate oxidase iron-sulfur subunit